MSRMRVRYKTCAPFSTHSRSFHHVRSVHIASMGSTHPGPRRQHNIYSKTCIYTAAHKAWECAKSRDIGMGFITNGGGGAQDEEQMHTNLDSMVFKVCF